MTPTVPVYHKWGVVKSVNAKTMQCTVLSQSEQIIATIKHGGSTVVIPKVGEIWEYYLSGTTYYMSQKISTSISDEESILLQGDVLNQASGTISTYAPSIYDQDQHGYFFNPVTGNINPDRAKNVANSVKAAAPKILSCQASAYTLSNGQPKGRIDVSWSAVDRDSDGNVASISSYNVEWAYESDNLSWNLIAKVESDSDPVKASILDLQIGSTVFVRVSANISNSSTSGLSSEVSTVVIPNYGKASDIPSAPILSTSFATIKAEWDGKTENGTSFSNDLKRIDVGFGTKEDSLSVVGSIVSTPGQYVVADLTDGTVYYVAFRSVNNSGNVSQWSKVSSIAAKSVITQEMIDEMNDKLDNAASDIDEQRTKTTSLESSISGLITWSIEAPTSEDKIVSADDIWFQTNPDSSVKQIWKPNADLTGWLKTTFGTDALTDEAITRAKIATGAIDGTKISDEVNADISKALQDSQKALNDAATATVTANGNLSQVTNFYAVSNSDVIVPETGWSTDRPTPLANQFVWTYTKTVKGDGTESSSSPVLATGTSAILVNIHSDRGLAFHNNDIDTTLKLTIICGSRQITDLAGLHEAFGTGSYIQWLALTGAERTPVVISSSDPMLSEDGFALTVSPDNVDTTVTFTAQVIV